MALSKLVIGLVAGVIDVATIGGVSTAVVTSNNRNTVNTVEETENKENEKTSINTNENKIDKETGQKSASSTDEKAADKQDKVMMIEEASESVRQKEAAAKSEDSNGGGMNMVIEKDASAAVTTGVEQETVIKNQPQVMNRADLEEHKEESEEITDQKGGDNSDAKSISTTEVDQKKVAERNEELNQHEDKAHVVQQEKTTNPEDSERSQTS